MNRFRLLTLLAGALTLASGCATLDTGNMSPVCRDQYNACLDSCQPASRPASRTPPDSVQGQSERRTPDTVTPGCVDTCNQKAKSCS
jgi:hypothetical protein